MQLDIVIIGRNESRNLVELSESLRYYPFQNIIYVDSNSQDDSAMVAKSFGWKVASLLPEGVLSASAGRSVGTELSSADWILYLDGDMRPELETIDFFINFLRNCNNDQIFGLTGDIVDVYNETDRHTRTQRSKSGDTAKWFGGSVILRRDMVIKAGNWNPNVFANEEIDLYARLHKLGGRVLYFQKPMVYHYTEYISKQKMLFSLINLFDVKNTRRGSLGLAMRSAMLKNSLWDFVIIHPEPFVVGLFTIIALLLLFYTILSSLVIFISLFTWIYLRRGMQYFFVSYILLLHAFLGLFLYRNGEVKYIV